MLNESALTYWRHTGYSQSDIQQVTSEIDDWLAARFDLKPDGTLGVTISKKVFETKQGHAPVTSQFIQDVMHACGDRLRPGSFIVWLEDGMWPSDHPLSRKAPIFAFGRHRLDTHTLLIPDPAFLGATGYGEELAEIDETEKTLDWNAKKPTVFWRGATSGHGFTGDGWKETPRAKLAFASKRIDDPAVLDAYLSLLAVPKTSPAFEGILEHGLLREYREFAEFLAYRYLIDIDGYCVAWKSLFLKLASRSTVLKVSSEYIQWYFDRIVPWKHFVPIASNLTDLDEIIAWIRAHDEQCREMAECASRLVRSITYEQVVADTGRELGELLACMRY